MGATVVNWEPSPIEERFYVSPEERHRRDCESAASDVLAIAGVSSKPSEPTAAAPTKKLPIANSNLYGANLGKFPV